MESVRLAGELFQAYGDLLMLGRTAEWLFDGMTGARRVDPHLVADLLVASNLAHYLLQGRPSAEIYKAHLAKILGARDPDGLAKRLEHFRLHGTDIAPPLRLVHST